MSKAATWHGSIIAKDRSRIVQKELHKLFLIFIFIFIFFLTSPDAYIHAHTYITVSNHPTHYQISYILSPPSTSSLLQIRNSSTLICSPSFSATFMLLRHFHVSLSLSLYLVHSFFFFLFILHHASIHLKRNQSITQIIQISSFFIFASFF